MVPGRFSMKAIKLFWRAPGQRGSQRAAGKVPGQPEFRAGMPDKKAGRIKVCRFVDIVEGSDRDGRCCTAVIVYLLKRSISGSFP